MQKIVFGLFCTAGVLLMMHCVDAAYVSGTKVKNNDKGALPLFVCSGMLNFAVLFGIITLDAGLMQGKLAAVSVALIGIAVFFARVYKMAKGSSRYRRISSIIVLSLLLVTSSFLLVTGLIYLCNF